VVQVSWLAQLRSVYYLEMQQQLSWQTCWCACVVVPLMCACITPVAVLATAALTLRAAVARFTVGLSILQLGRTNH
jgi:hypothetical protein